MDTSPLFTINTMFIIHLYIASLHNILLLLHFIFLLPLLAQGFLVIYILFDDNEHTSVFCSLTILVHVVDLLSLMMRNIYSKIKMINALKSQNMLIPENIIYH